MKKIASLFALLMFCIAVSAQDKEESFIDSCMDKVTFLYERIVALECDSTASASIDGKDFRVYQRNSTSQNSDFAINYDVLENGESIIGTLEVNFLVKVIVLGEKRGDTVIRHIVTLNSSQIFIANTTYIWDKDKNSYATREYKVDISESSMSTIRDKLSLWKKLGEKAECTKKDFYSTHR